MINVRDLKVEDKILLAMVSAAFLYIGIKVLTQETFTGRDGKVLKLDLVSRIVAGVILILIALSGPTLYLFGHLAVSSPHGAVQGSMVGAIVAALAFLTLGVAVLFIKKSETTNQNTVFRVVGFILLVSLAIFVLVSYHFGYFYLGRVHGFVIR